MQARGTENRPCYCWCWAGMGESSGQGLLWVSQHCRQGLRACSGPPPSPALLHLPKPRDGTGAAPGSPVKHSRACKRNSGSTGTESGSKAQGVQGIGGFQSLLFLKPPQLQSPSKGPKALLASVGTLVRHRGPWRAVSALSLELQPPEETPARFHPSCQHTSVG